MKIKNLTPITLLLRTAWLAKPSGASGEVPFEQVNVDTYLTNPHCKALGDIDGDGYPDLAAGGAYANGAVVWYKYVNRTNWTRHVIATNAPTTYGFTTSMELGDVDGDGDLDIIVPTGSLATGGHKGDHVWWFENPRPSGDPRTGVWIKHDIGAASAHDLVVGDVNGDGRLDVVAQLRSVTLLIQTATGGWTKVAVATNADEGTALGDIDRDGDLDIVVGGRWLENPLPTGPVTGPWTQRSYDNSIAPNTTQWACWVADLNRDGRPDIVLAPADFVHDGRLRVYLEPADPRSGTWLRNDALSGSGMVHSLQAADIDRDGNPDLVTAEMEQSTTGKRVMILYNRGGTGTNWSAPQVVGTTGSHWVKVGDIDRDGDLDIYGINHGNNGGEVNVHVWRNLLSERGKLSLDRWQRRVVDPARPAQAVFIGSQDIDRDGRKDIITGAWWYRNPGSAGGVWTRTTIGSPLNNMAAVHDFDGDGDLDILGTQGVGANSDARFVWARNDGSGVFSILSNITSGDGDFLQGVAVDRFTNGGPFQVALSWHVAGQGIQMLTVPADPVGQTWPWRRISTTSQDEQLSAGDVDRDGDRDLVMGTKWLRDDGAAWTPFTLNSTAGDPDRNRLADINGDGRLDVVVGFEAISIPGKLAWYETPANATTIWPEHIIATNVVGPMSLDVADMDSDGDLDVVVGEHNLASPSSARLWIFENVDGLGLNWTSHLVYTGDEHHDGAQVVDIDGDGDLDIISIGWGHSNVLLYENLAAGDNALLAVSITSPTNNATFTAPASLVIEAAASGGAVSVSNVQFYAGRTFIGADSSSPYSLTWSNVPPGNYLLTAKVTGAQGAFALSSPVAVMVNGTNSGDLPMAGLALWLRADKGLTLNGSSVAEWADQSGQGRLATQPVGVNQPLLAVTPLGKPVLRFDGANDFLSFNLPVNGLAGMTIFLLSNSRAATGGGSSQAGNAAIFWNETTSWGTVYLSPFQNHVNFRFGTTQVNNRHIYTRPAPIGTNYSITVSKKDGTTDMLYVDGALVVSASNKLASITSCRDTGNLGRGYNDDTYFAGDIMGVLVYTRGLSGAERQVVEQYLLAKCFSNAPPAVTLVTPTNNASFSAPADITLTAEASDSDGTVTNVEFYVEGTLLGRDSTSPYSIVWSNVPSGTYTLTAKATDNKDAFRMSAPIAIFGTSGQLAGAVTAAAPSYNLTVLGAGDWAHWGRGDTGNNAYGRFDHKSSGGSRISNVSLVGAGEVHGSWNDDARKVSWTDGTPTAGVTDDMGYIWSNGALGTGLAFTVPADTTESTLFVLRWQRHHRHAEAHLSDGSAPDFADAQSGAGMYMNLYSLSYRAGTAGQSLTITYLKTGNTYPGGLGSVDLKAAWLIQGSNNVPSLRIALLG